MRILIGYSMRSGSTLLQHIIDQHSQIKSYSDVSSIPWIPFLRLGLGPKNICIKPLDLFFLLKNPWFYGNFDKFIWLTRDPRDSYISTIESGYAYLFWPKGKQVEGIDIGLLDRWKRIQRQYLDDPEKWLHIRYEDLTTTPEKSITDILDFVELPQEKLLPFKPYDFASGGGDYKLAQTKTISNKSVGRYKEKLTPAQIAVIDDALRPEMEKYGYLDSDVPKKKTNKML